jgi:hypothetical protein
MADKSYPAKIISTLSNSRAGCIVEMQHDMQFCVGQTVWISREPPATEAPAAPAPMACSRDGCRLTGPFPCADRLCPFLPRSSDV